MNVADRINNAIKDGMTVYVASYGRVTKINKKFKAVKYWSDLGFDMFKMNGERVMMIDGYVTMDMPKWSDASGCKITAS